MSDVLAGEVFDIREVIEEFERLEEDEDRDEDEEAEFTEIKKFLDEVRGRGGDHQWRGDWYPVTFIDDDHFEGYAREFAEDIYGEEIRSAKWPFNHIDWDDAAGELKVDYSSVEADTGYVLVQVGHEC